MQLVGLNFFAGDLAGPDCGVLSIPEPRRSSSATTSTSRSASASNSASRRSTRSTATGSTTPHPSEQDELGRENLGRAATAADRIGATVLVEPVSGPKPYPLRTADDAVAVVQAVRGAGTECRIPVRPVPSRQQRRRPRPGDRATHRRGQPRPDRRSSRARRTRVPAQLDLDRYLSALAERGYCGWVGLEYKPTTDTETSLGWLPRARRAAPHRVANQQGATHMTTIAFIGLGIMGSPMAVHLQNAGHRRRGLQPSARQGRSRWSKPAAGRPRRSPTPSRALRWWPSWSPTPPMWRRSSLARTGSSTAAEPGTLVIDFSSIRPDVTAQLAEAAQDQGFRLA